MQVLLKEKTLNTEQLLKHHTELKEELASEKKAKQKAESAASKLKKSNEGMQKRVGRLEEQVAQLQSSVALLLQQQPHTGGIASGSTKLDNIVTRTEMNALKTQVSGLEKQLGMWNKAMKEVQQPGGGIKSNGISKKKPAGGGPAAAAPVEEDPVRARAVAMLKANKPGGEARSPSKEQQRQQQQQLPPKKRVRLSEDQQQVVMVGGSAGGSEAAPPGFADVAIAALRAVMGADGEQQLPSTAAVQDAVRILGPALRNNYTTSLNGDDGGTNNNNINSSTQKRNIVAAFACAVLECAAAAPARRFAAPSLSPEHWFEISTPAAGGGGGGDGKIASLSSKSRRAVKEIENSSRLPSFLGVWCSSEVLQRHSLPWLLHCAVEISTAAAAEEEEEAEGAEAQNLCHILAQDLALLVIKDLAASSSSRPLLHSATELCAAASAAGALWRSHGDFRSFQKFTLDILLSKLGNSEIDALAPVAAAIDSWQDALFQNKGALGSAVHQLLQYACTVGKSSRSLNSRLAASWLHKLGVEEWEWKEELSGEEAEAGVMAARKQLAKFVPPSLRVAAKSINEFI